MKYNIRKNWLNTLDTLRTRPVILLPFIVVAFLECLSLEFLYFSTRAPLSFVANPIIRKFFGEAFIHYPGNLAIVPQLFYYKQMAIYIILGVLLTAISINIFKNIKNGLPVTARAMVKNSLHSYFSFLIYGILVTVLMFLLKTADLFVLPKVLNRISTYFFNIPDSIYNITVMLSLFFTNMILQVFLIATIPVIVIEKKRLFKALAKSIALGARNFFTVFALMFLPFFIYLPIVFLKSFSTQLADKAFPEINIYISVFGSILSVFLDSFAIICVSQFLLDKNKDVKGKAA